MSECLCCSNVGALPLTNNIKNINFPSIAENPKAVNIIANYFKWHQHRVRMKVQSFHLLAKYYTDKADTRTKNNIKASVKYEVSEQVIMILI